MSATPPAPHLATLAGRHRNIVFTYDSTSQTDGVGAQLQRMYGIYAVAKLLGASYLHSPLTRVNYQGLNALENEALDPRFHRDFNKLFKIPSDVTSPAGPREVSLPDITLKRFYELVATADSHGPDDRELLVRLVMPYGIADRFPDCYGACKAISPFAATAREGRTLRVAIHVRRGELLVVDSERMLPNAYYIRAARALVDVFDALGVPYQLELCTEVPVHDFIIRPDQPVIFGRIDAPAAITRAMSRLDEFRVLPNLVECVNETAIDCIRRLATADVLVMSRSSFSYLGAILNRSGIVLYHPFWHGAPSSWIAVSTDGQFDVARARTLLRDDQTGA